MPAENDLIGRQFYDNASVAGKTKSSMIKVCRGGNMNDSESILNYPRVIILSLIGTMLIHSVQAHAFFFNGIVNYKFENP